MFYNTPSWNTLHHLVGHSDVARVITRARARHAEGSLAAVFDFELLNPVVDFMARKRQVHRDEGQP